MSYIAELQAGHWLILAGCVSILAGAIGVSMTKSGWTTEQGSNKWTYRRVRLQNCVLSRRVLQRSRRTVR